VAPEKGDIVDLVGWITMNNQSGKTFENAKIKLMAGDVNKIRPMPMSGFGGGFGGGGSGGGAPTVTERGFDEYHLYTLARPATLRDRQMKQVEFVRGDNVLAKTIYIYDGASSDWRFSGEVNTDRNYGTQSNKKVWVAREIMNAETNHLGLPLPKGKLRFYRRDDDGQLEFTGEDTIDHTPRDEMVRVNTGNAFDLVGERKQTDFKEYIFNPPYGLASNFSPSPYSNPYRIAIDPNTGLPMSAPTTQTPTNMPPAPWIEESFEIRVRNHKKEPVEIRVVEHLYRWSNWQIIAKSDEFKKTDAQTIEFRPVIKPDDEKVITYTVHYSW